MAKDATKKQIPDDELPPSLFDRIEEVVRIEDIVVMENGRARVMSHAPKLTTAAV